MSRMASVQTKLVERGEYIMDKVFPNENMAHGESVSRAEQTHLDSSTVCLLQQSIKDMTQLACTYCRSLSVEIEKSESVVWNVERFTETMRSLNQLSSAISKVCQVLLAAEPAANERYISMLSHSRKSDGESSTPSSESHSKQPVTCI